MMIENKKEIIVEQNNLEKKEQLNHVELKQGVAKEVYLLLGFLGAGKTTLLRELATYLTEKGEDFTVIVNDVGSYNVDAQRLKDLDPVALTKGCLCCSGLDGLRTTLEQLKQEPKRAWKIIIEPTGNADGVQIKKLVNELGLSSRVITLVNASAALKMGAAQQQITATQSALADVIALTHLPQDVEMITQLKSSITSEFPEKSLVEIPLSKRKEKLIKEQDKNPYHELFIQLDTINPAWNLDLENLSIGHPKFKAKSFDLTDSSFSFSHLEKLISSLGDDLLRAKGALQNNGEILDFDYVYGDAKPQFSKRSWHAPHLNIITQNPLSSEHLTMITAPDPQLQSHVSFAPEQKLYTPLEVVQKVTTLLQQYKNYMDNYHKKLNIEQEYRSTWDTQLLAEIQTIDEKLDHIWDEMKFDNPLVRLGYKYQAYKGTSKQVETLADLEQHCATKTDICYKRFHFLNTQLKKHYGYDLIEKAKKYPDQSLVAFLQTSPEIKELSQNLEFMTQRLEHEYYQEGSRVAKWEDYIPQS